MSHDPAHLFVMEGSGETLFSLPPISRDIREDDIIEYIDAGGVPHTYKVESAVLKMKWAESHPVSADLDGVSTSVVLRVGLSVVP